MVQLYRMSDSKTCTIWGGFIWLLYLEPMVSVVLLMQPCFLSWHFSWEERLVLILADRQEYIVFW